MLALNETVAALVRTPAEAEQAQARQVAAHPLSSTRSIHHAT